MIQLGDRGPQEKRFDVSGFLTQAGLGRRVARIHPKDAFFSQGDTADYVFYLQRGRAKLTVAPTPGKEATITLLSAGDLVGEESLAGAVGPRMSTATAITACTALKITRDEMIRVLHEQRAFSETFLSYLLSRSIRAQAELVDQLFTSSERRLARVLLLMAEIGKPREPETLIPPVTEMALAEMIGTTRSAVSDFMTRFQKLGLIDYNGRIHVHKSLLNVFLLDDFPGRNAQEPPLDPGPQTLLGTLMRKLQA